MESIDYITEDIDELDSLLVNIEEIQPGFIGLGAVHILRNQK